MVKSSIHWSGFEKPKGWDGLNNAAINSFNSDVINSFVREMFQNSNDARQKDKLGNKKKLKIEIGYKKIETKVFPEYESFLDIVKKIAGEPENAGHEQFFKQALSDFGSDGYIPVFVYKDFNTEGLEGSDDDAKSSFSACVLSEGITVKGDRTAGGSYGIGKNSIYSFSKLRTVLYSSLNLNNEKIFQGLAKLASYRDSGKTYDYRTFLGKGEKLSSIRDYAVLPENIIPLVDRDEAGLTQIAICPIGSGNDWVNDFTKAILTNYWLLIDNDQLEVKLYIDDVTASVISKDNLADLMFENFNPESFNPEINNQGNPFDFYSCYKNSVPEQRPVHMLGDMKFYYQELDHKKTNSVVFIRNGMVIYSEPIWGFSSIGYCGVVVCNNEDGNSFLRMMEPPTHDKFDPQRLNDRVVEYNENDGKKALEQTRKLIRDCLNKISEKYRKKAEEIPWLNNLLSSIKGINAGGKGARTGEESEKETVDRVTTESKHALIFNSINHNITISSVDGDTTTPGGGGSPRPPHPPGPPKPPSPEPGPKKPIKAATIMSRIFKNGQNVNGSYYKILLSSNKGIGKKNLKLLQVGDSGSSASFEIQEVTDNRGDVISFEKIFNKNKDLIAYKLKDVSIPNELLLHINEPYKSTFKLEEI